MGDSCTEFGRYDNYLAELVNQHTQQSFSFVNVGISGWSTYQGLQQLKQDVLSLHPKIITIYYGWNDHWKSFGLEDKNLGQYNLAHPVLVTLAAFSRIRIFQLFNYFLLNIRTRQDKSEFPERVSLADFRNNLCHMVQIAKNNDIIPVLITAPSSHTKKGKNLTI